MPSQPKTKNGKKPTSAKRGGLNSWEKVAIPIILILVVWGGYSLSQSTPRGAGASASSTVFSPTFTPTQTNPPQTADFTLPVVGVNGLTGESATLSSFFGKVILLEFMEPWCPHCQNMAHILDSLYSQFGSQDVVFISVSGPWNGATSGDTAKFIQTYGSSWTYLYDSSGSTMSLYGVNATPTFFIIGKNGSIITSLQGEQSYNTLAGILAQASG